MSVQVPELQCRLDSAVFNFDARAAVLRVPQNNCTDMCGAIRWVHRLMPDVETIVVTEAGRMDIVYHRASGDDWTANDFRAMYA